MGPNIITVFIFILVSIVFGMTWAIFAKLNRSEESEDSRISESKKITLSFAIISTIAVIANTAFYFYVKPGNKDFVLLLLIFTIFNLATAILSWILYGYIVKDNFDAAKKLSGAVAGIATATLLFFLVYAGIKYDKDRKHKRKVAPEGGAEITDDWEKTEKLW